VILSGEMILCTLHGLGRRAADAVIRGNGPYVAGFRIHPPAMPDGRERDRRMKCSEIRADGIKAM
jgi:hypothetical protein